MISVVQIDGLPDESVERLLEAGELPHLAEALRRAPRRELETCADLFPASVYPTLYSGLGPDEHEAIYPFQFDPATQRVWTADRFRRVPMLWERIATAGRSSLVIDPYEALPPASELAGSRLISGWQLSERVVLRRFSRPRGWWSAAAARHGLPPRATETFGPRRERELRALAGALERSPARVATLLEAELARTAAPDLIWVTLLAPHIGGHRLWGTPALEAILRAADRALGRILDALPDEHELLLVCPIGMDADSARADLLPEMLERILAGERDSEPDGGNGDDSGSMWRLRAAVPAGLRAAIAASIPATVARRLTARLELRGVSWAQTQAFAHPSDNQGYIRLNLRGRERDGIVDPADAAGLRDRIARGLEEFHDPDGRPIVEEVVALELAGGLPDLVVRWAPVPATEGTSVDLGVAHSERFGTVRRHGAGSGRSGNHPPGGAWVAAAGLSDADRPRLEDIAATVLDRLAIERDGLEGRPLPRPAQRASPAVAESARLAA